MNSFALLVGKMTSNDSHFYRIPSPQVEVILVNIMRYHSQNYVMSHGKWDYVGVIKISN